MKHISSRIAIYSLLYILILFFIFFLQFKKGTGFSHESFHLNVSGRFFINENKQRELLLPLHITSNGLLIFITAEEPIRALLNDDTIKDLTPLSYEIKNDTFDLFCEEGVKLHFATNNRAIPNRKEILDSLHIVCILPDSIKEIYLPYKLTQRARIEKSGENILVQYRGKSFAFSKMQDGLLGQQDSAPFISFSHDSASIYYHENIAKEGFNIEDMLDSPFASKELYEKNLKTFRNIAKSSLEKEVRERRHTEKTIITLFAEEGIRGLYDQAIINYPSSLLPKNRRTYLSSPFYGNIIENYKVKMLEDEGEITIIRTKLNNKDSSLFQKQNILSFLITRKQQSLISSMISWIETLDEKSLSPYELVNILLICSEYKKLNNKDKLLDDLSIRCEAQILSCLFSIDNKIYIRTKDKELETLPTFSIAISLIKYGTIERKELLCNIGYSLFNSLYSFTEEPSSFPSTFKITQDENKRLWLMAIDKNVLTAQMLYNLFYCENTYLAHEVDLSIDDKNEVFAFTIAKNITMKKANQRNIIFEFTFQSGGYHYVVLHGIKPFNNIKMENVLGYKTDPRFELYNASGYIYDRKNNMLYLKLKHNNEKETVELYY